MKKHKQKLKFANPIALWNEKASTPPLQAQDKQALQDFMMAHQGPNTIVLLGGLTIRGDKAYVPNVGWVKTGSQLQGKIVATALTKQQNGQWKIEFLCEEFVK
jgi:hypothetical protein